MHDLGSAHGGRRPRPHRRWHGAPRRGGCVRGPDRHGAQMATGEDPERSPAPPGRIAVRALRRGAPVRGPAAGRLCLPARHVPGRRLPVRGLEDLPAPGRPGHRLPGGDRGVPDVHGGDQPEPERLHRPRLARRWPGRLCVLQAVALPLPPARPRQEAPPPHRPRALAAGPRGRGAVPVPARPDPLGRLARREQGPRQGPRLRVSALSVLEPVGGHPAAVHRHLRPGRRGVAALGGAGTSRPLGATAWRCSTSTWGRRREPATPLAGAGG
jgi:hypothetical protein